MRLLVLLPWSVRESSSGDTVVVTATSSGCPEKALGTSLKLEERDEVSGYIVVAAIEEERKQWQLCLVDVGCQGHGVVGKTRRCKEEQRTRWPEQLLG
ncbi:hypothetical protein M0R45_018280 [Rubus argutus]|uniref:Secreted protein n=1 Tax=Rubus argutus TaxID=59490 RepID=A0AAW1X1Z5_RUBAR